VKVNIELFFLPYSMGLIISAFVYFEILKTEGRDDLIKDN